MKTLDKQASKQAISSLFTVVKTVGIFLVALAHLPVPEPLSTFINAFHMPLFFLVAGYYLTVPNTGLVELIKKKTKTLLLPYLLFAAVSWVFWYFVGSKYGDDASSRQEASTYLSGIFIGIASKEYLGFNLPLWFLPSLFVAHLLMWFSRRVFSAQLWLSMALYFALGILLRVLDVRLPWGADVALFAMPFICLGFELRRRKRGLRKLLAASAFKKSLYLLCCLALTIGFSLHNQRVDMYALEFNNYLFFIAGALSGMGFVLCLASLFPKHALWEFFGRNTLVILGLHLMSFTLLKGIQVFILGIPVEALSQSIWGCLVYVLASFALLSLPIYLINRYIPWALGRGTGILWNTEK